MYVTLNAEKPKFLGISILHKFFTNTFIELKFGMIVDVWVDNKTALVWQDETHPIVCVSQYVEALLKSKMCKTLHYALTMLHLNTAF